MNIQRRLLALRTGDAPHALASAECASLTGSPFGAGGIAECLRIDHIPHAAYVRQGMRLIAHAPSLDDLVARVRAEPADANAFRIECGRLPTEGMPSKRRVIVTLADALEDARPDLDNPEHRFYVGADADELLFAEILTESAHTYRKHDAKPYRTSNSLPSRLARALVNLVVPGAQTIYDPCCGTGSILLEASALGARAFGGDINPRMAGMTSGNAAHFGYDVDVAVADAREPTRAVDAVVTDLPYGRNLRASESVTRAILAGLAAAAPVAVFAAGLDMSAWLADLGCVGIEVYPVQKSKGFTRYVHRARSRVAGDSP